MIKHFKFQPCYLIALSLALLILLTSVATGLNYNFEFENKLSKIHPKDTNSIFLHLKACGSFDPLKNCPSIPKDLTLATTGNYYILQFKGPVGEEWKKAVEKLGCSLYDYIPDYGFLALVNNAKSKENIVKLPFVRALTQFQPGYKIEPQLLHKTGFVNVNIVLLEAEQSNSNPRSRAINSLNYLEVISAITRTGGEILQKDRNIVEASIPAYAVKELAFLDSVLWIEEKYDIKDCLDIARVAIGAESLHGTINSSTPANPVVLGLGGKDVIIAVMDGGLRTTHEDFNEPPGKKVAFLYGAEGASTSHGTLVTGCAVGDGSANGATTRLYRGAAPNAKFVFQRRWASDTTTPGLLTCFKDAYNYGASIHTNSWLLAEGGKQVNRYGSYSQLADIGVRDADIDKTGEQPLIITWAAGNEAGTTVGEPATAKNIITVGASDDKATTTTTDDAMASWSSQGPTRDGRLKPDLVAPGVDIYTTSDTTDTSYTGESGTSLSAPIVAGACAIVVEDYIARFGTKPSPALVKALLINRATPLSGYTYPGYYQGWGLVNLTEICTKWDSIYFDDQSVELNTFEEKTYYVKATPGTFRINLVWTDAYGLVNADKVLVNDLDLVVIAPNGTVYYGNDFTSPFNDTRDSVNNVEGVIITTPDTSGVYAIRVKAANVPKGPQDYALVVSNAAEGLGRVIWSDKNEFGYYKAGSAVVKIYDKDLNTDPGVQENAQVKVYSTKDSAGITVTCTEESVNSPIFTATVNFIETGSSGGNDILVSSRDTVTVRYNDTAPVNYIHIYDNASYDSIAPAISNVFISSIKPASATIHLWTDEHAEIRLWLKNNATGNWTEDDSAGHWYHPAETYTKSHFEYILTSWRSCLKPNTEYWVQVNATDKAGNKAVDNNSGNYYRFKTPAQPFKILFVDDDYVGGCGYWFSYTLNLTGYYHDYYRVASGTANGPASATLTQYDIVVWDCGVAGQKSEWGTSLTSTDMSNIKSYLQTSTVGAMSEKPRFVILGWGVAQEVNGATGGPDFLSGSLYCNYNKDAAGLDMTGVSGDILGDNLTADVGFDSLTDYWKYGDDISVASGGIKSFDWDGASDAACVRYGTYNTTNQTVFLPILWAFFDSNRDGKEYGIATQLEVQRRIFEDYLYAPLTS
ncbi:MAG: S8 family serine peptidase, partial [Candidatus Thermoplasmatota archaeon]